MANTYAPFGLRSFGHQDGSAPTMGLTKFSMLSSDTSVIGTGDVVVQSTASGFPGYITQPSTASVTPPGYGLVGVFAGCEYYNSNVGRVVWSSYFPGSVGSSSPVTAYVIQDPQMQFIAQCSTTSVIGSSNIGMNIGYCSSLIGSANTTTGISALALASSGVSASSSYPFRIVDLYQNFAPPGVNGTSTTAGAIVVVVPNAWATRTLTGVTT